MASQSSFGVGNARECLTGGGEMGALMRARDWAATPLGPVEDWPQSLRTSVSICLNSRFAILIWWGPELVMLYNDAYREIIGSKHPAALGEPGRKCFPEIWHIVGPMLDKVMSRGEATRSDDLLLHLERHGYPEECYFTFSYSPIRDESGGVGGVFTPVADTTEKVIGARRLQTLQELASRSRNARDVQAVCFQAAETLSRNPVDVPFSATYLYSEDRTRAERIAESGMAAAGAELPATVSLNGDASNAIASAAEAGRIKEVSPQPGQPWPYSVDSMLVLPLVSAAHSTAAGFLVAGVNPKKRLDREYRTFFELAAGQIAAAIAEARAYEDERKRAEALAELDRAKTHFFSNVSHELRTPLTLILAPLEDALAEAAPHSREQLELIHRNALRLLRLVNTLLDFTRIEAGRARAKIEPTDLAQLTSDVAGLFRFAIEKSGLRYTVDCPPLDQPAWVDSEMWEKILLNLLSNALKFTLSGEIGVTLRRAGERVELAVRDTGEGIADAEIPRVFERFHRIEGASGRTHEGSGIGLALVQELAQLHGGDVRVSSVLGKGSTFTVSIPLGAPEPAAREARSGSARTTADEVARAFVEESLRWLPAEQSGDAAETASRSKPGILVAEDNADMRDYICRILRNRYDVVAVGDGEAALEALRKRPFDLVVSDVMMPRLDGFGLIRGIRGAPETCLVPVILLSARAGEEAGIEGLEAGSDAYLVKPFSRRELLARVDAQLANARLRAAAAERERHARREAEVEQSRWRGLLENAPAAMAVLQGPELRFELVNDEYARAAGRPGPAWFKGQRIRDALPELVPQGFIEVIEKVYRSGEAAFGKRQLVRLNRGASGALEDRYFHCAYQPARGPGGEVEGVLVHAVDVTDEVLAQRRLEETEAQFRSLADSIPNLAWIAEADGSRPWFNRRWYEFTGVEEGESEGWGWMSAHDPLRVESVLAGYRRQIENGEPWEDTVRLRGRTGEYRWFLSRAIPILNVQGRPTRWFGTSTDITTEMEARDRLRESEKRAIGRAAELQAIMDAVPAAIYIAHDPECREVVGNPAANELHQLTDSGQSLRPASDPNSPTRFRFSRDGAPIAEEDLPLQTVARTLQPIHDYEFDVEFGDGSRRTLIGNAVPLLDEHGQGRGAVAAFIDITERRRMQDRLREAQHLESVGLLAGGVAHDFNNLLVPIVGYAGMARESLETWSPVQPMLSEIEKAAERAAHLTRQMLAYAGKARFVVEEIDVANMARETVRLAGGTLPKGIAVVVKADPGLPPVEADPGEIQLMFTNLLLNAAEAIGEERGSILIHITAVNLTDPAGRGFRVAGNVVPGRYVSIEVIDSGCGMSEAVQTKIFEPFFTTRFLGRGLGLAAVAGIVRAHNWGVALRSAPGQGSTFQVFLPAATAQTRAPESSQGEEVIDPSGSASILVVDDEDIVLRTAKLALERHGYQVFVANSGAAALRLCQNEARGVDLVLLDLSMPGMSGQETFAALRKLDPGVKVLISSGYSESEAMRTFLGQKPAGFVQKPYTAMRLASMVKKVVAHN